MACVRMHLIKLKEARKTPMGDALQLKSAAIGATATSSDTSGRPKALDAAAVASELARLATSPQGLTTVEAQKRLAEDGPNAIVAAEEPLWHKAVGYFWGPIPWMIEAAALISFLRRDWPDLVVVMGLLIYNAAVGFWQDAKAASALAALRKGLALKAQALRDGKWQSVDATRWSSAT
jgi:H+-transporting ATPase